MVDLRKFTKVIKTRTRDLLFMRRKLNPEVVNKEKVKLSYLATVFGKRELMRYQQKASEFIDECASYGIEARYSAIVCPRTWEVEIIWRDTGQREILRYWADLTDIYNKLIGRYGRRLKEAINNSKILDKKMLEDEQMYESHRKEADLRVKREEEFRAKIEEFGKECERHEINTNHRCEVRRFTGDIYIVWEDTGEAQKAPFPYTSESMYLELEKRYGQRLREAKETYTESKKVWDRSLKKRLRALFKPRVRE